MILEPVTTRIDRETNQKLKLYAAFYGLPLQELHHQILQEWLSLQPPIIKTREPAIQAS